MDTRLINKKTICQDGVALSIQASERHYCTPRNNQGPWTHVEVGFIEDKNDQTFTPPNEWAQYADGEFPSNVYAHVPVELVVDFVTQHGGSDSFPSNIIEGYHRICKEKVS